MSEQSQQWLQEASAAVQEGRFEDALKLAEQSIEAESSSEAWVIRGIALAQLSRPEDATAAFREGIRINPNNARAYYNLATHLYQLKQLAEARAMALEAVRIEPGNQSARNLMVLIDQELGTSSVETPNWNQPPGTDTMGTSMHGGAVPFVDKMGMSWNIIGISLAVLSLATLAYSISIQSSFIIELWQNMENEGKVKEIVKEAQRQQANNGLLPFVSIISWICILGTLAWGCLDIANRRKSWFWLFGFIPCSCCGGSFLILLIYMAFGRKMENPRE